MAKNNPERLENIVRKYRLEHNELTQEELAKKISVTRQTIIALEAGGYVPSLMLAFRLARVFGCSIEEIFQYHKGSR